MFRPSIEVPLFFAVALVLIILSLALSNASFLGMAVVSLTWSIAASRRGLILTPKRMGLKAGKVTVLRGDKARGVLLAMEWITNNVDVSMKSILVEASTQGIPDVVADRMMEQVSKLYEVRHLFRNRDKVIELIVPTESLMPLKLTNRAVRIALGR